jgi:hypothetical protein
MDKLTRLIKEVLSSPPKKDCGCGCHGKCTKSPTLNENLGVKVIMTENMKYHIDNKKPLTENTFRYGSKAFLDLWTEARYLYSRNAIDLSESDKQIILETHLGERGLFNGELVPLDLPMEDLDENTDDVVAALNNPNIEDDVKSMLFNAYKSGKLTSTQVINIIKKTVKEHLNEAEFKGKEVQLGKPKRGGSKKFFVYVKDPKTKKVKKVSFGDTTGLSAKINNPKARKAFAARHDCKNKKDRTKAGYWSCNLGRYAKSLGMKNNFSGYW